MPNQSGKAYGLTVLCPLKEVDDSGKSVTIKLKNTLLNLKESPMQKVPNTYLARFYILEDVFYEDAPYELEHLKSKYLVFTSNFYGERDEYLRGMYKAMKEEIVEVWQDCYGFSKDRFTENDFIQFIEDCQVDTTFYFNGSTDESLEEQLKALYLKQEFSKFVFFFHIFLSFLIQDKNSII